VSKRRHRNLTKAAARPVAPAATFTAEQVQALLQSQNKTGQLATMLPRTDPQVPFGPGLPLQPSLIDPPRDDGSGRSEPRIYEYPVTINLPGVSDRHVPWKVLRDAAEIPIVRDCIRIRKSKLAAREWDIVITKRALQTYKQQDPDTSSVQIKKDLRDKLNPEIARLIEFWQQPDPQQGEDFAAWATKGLEEHHVLDALAIYPYRNRGGQQMGFRILDGSTVKPLLDHLGGRPMPPQPAYQQVLWGFPRGEFVADCDTDGKVLNGYTADRLIYRRRELRTFSPYGMSGVEQALTDVDLYLRRHEWNRGQWSDGVAPAGWILNDGAESWTPQQLAEYSRAFNDLYSGKTLERMRFHLLPPGMHPQETADVGEKFKPDYDLHLIKLVAMHLDTTIAELGFTESKGLGSSGYHEGQENVQERKADAPDQRWLQGVLTGISRTYLGMPDELEFRFLGLDSEDEDAADEVLDRQVKGGRLTLNESREEQGRAPYSFAEADMPIVETGRGIIFLENSSKLAPPGEMITPAQAPPSTAPPEGEDAQPGSEDPATGQQQGQKPAPKPAAGQGQPKPASDGQDAAKAEIAAFWKWHKNGHTVGRRPFVFKAATRTDAMLHEVPLDRVVFKTAGGGARPKVLDPKDRDAWPAWAKDRETARFWAARMREALSGAPTRMIATRWLALRKTTTADPQTEARRRDALAWLSALGFSVTPQIRRTLTGLYTDAYMLGDHSAQVLLGQIEHDPEWNGWQPGDTAATTERIAEADLSPGLQRMLAQADRIATGINHTRARDVAEVLADAVDEQPTVDELDADLAEVLEDADAAEMIAETEVARGIAQAATDRYTIAPGITRYLWATGSGNVCVRCQANEDAGPILIGQSFPNGGAPPLHPRCACALLPDLSGLIL
jgi:hypothetical protein